MVASTTRAHEPESACASTHFLTFSCNSRKPWLAEPACRDALMELLREDASQRLIALHAWVVMPSHLHLLATGASSPALPWAGSFKKRFALHRRPALRACLPPEARSGAFWLPGGGHHRRIWSHQFYAQRMRYIHENPVRAALCDRMSAWRWSSAIDALQRQRPDAPQLSPRPETLIDLVWWRHPAIHARWHRDGL